MAIVEPFFTNQYFIIRLRALKDNGIAELATTIVPGDYEVYLWIEELIESAIGARDPLEPLQNRSTPVYAFGPFLSARVELYSYVDTATEPVLLSVVDLPTKFDDNPDHYLDWGLIYSQ